jgi:hypothetical protein
MLAYLHGHWVKLRALGERVMQGGTNKSQQSSDTVCSGCRLDTLVVPSLLQVVTWSQCLLDAQFTTLATDGALQPVLAQLQSTLDSYVAESHSAVMVSSMISYIVNGGSVPEPPAAQSGGWAAQWLDLTVPV